MTVRLQAQLCADSTELDGCSVFFNPLHVCQKKSSHAEVQEFMSDYKLFPWQLSILYKKTTKSLLLGLKNVFSRIVSIHFHILTPTRWKQSQRHRDTGIPGLSGRGHMHLCFFFMPSTSENTSGSHCPSCSVCVCATSVEGTRAEKRREEKQRRKWCLMKIVT